MDLLYHGGGIRGAAHIGVIRALQENNIKIDAIAGTSAGSIITALYGMNYTTDEMIKLFRFFSKEVINLSPKFLFTEIRRVKGIALGGLSTGYSIENAIEEAGRLKGITNIKDIKMRPVIVTIMKQKDSEEESWNESFVISFISARIEIIMMSVTQ